MPKRSGPVTCNHCGQTWPRDPALEVSCPACGAGVGQWCKRPSEHDAWWLHHARDTAAMEAGLLVKCPRKKSNA